MDALDRSPVLELEIAHDDRVDTDWAFLVAAPSRRVLLRLVVLLHHIELVKKQIGVLLLVH